MGIYEEFGVAPLINASGYVTRYGAATLLRNHAGEIWACDFLPVTDLLFRPL